MTAGTGLAQRWEITGQRSGEVSATREHAPGLELWLLGLPRGTTESEVRGWLHDVAGVAAEAAHGAVSDPAIPTLLHHALTGLLFSHAEVWERPGEPAPCSVVYTSSEDEIGFGWVGEAQVEVTLDGMPVPSRWIVVRDSTGREARAFRARSGNELAMRLSWLADAHDPASPMMTLEARWPGGVPRVAGAPAAPGPDTAPHESPATAQAGIELPATIEEWVAQEEGTAGSPIDAPPLGEIRESAATHDAVASIGGADESVIPPGSAIASDSAAEDPAAPLSGPDTSSSVAASVADAAHAAPGQDAERPSSGIARWLQRNFAWLGHARSTPATRPTPPVETPPAARIEEPAEQMPLGLAADEVAASSMSPGTDVSGDTAGSEPSASADERIEPGPAAIPVDDASPGPEPNRVEAATSLPVVRSFEDELAASAAALAAAISGVEPPLSDTLPRWREASPAGPGGVFETLPECIPPTPEPAALTARTAAARPEDPHGLDLREPAPAAFAAPVPIVAAPVTSEPASSKPPAPAAVEPSGPPRLEVTPRPLLRRPGEPAPAESGHEIHARSLEPPPAGPSPKPTEPLVIERVGIEPAPLASSPSAIAPPVASAGPMGGPVVPAADPVEWISRFKRPEPVSEPDEFTETGSMSATDEASLLDAARRDEWRELHASASASLVAAPIEPAPPVAAPPVAAPPVAAPPAAAPSAAAPSVVAPPVAASSVVAPSAAAPSDREPPSVRTRRVPAQHPAWPEASELDQPRGFDRRWVWAGVVVAILFGVGWLVGAVQWPGTHAGEDARKGRLASLLTTLGFHGPHYKVSVASRPDGAWIRLDGHDLQQRTPANLELTPGHHVLALSFGPQWGESEYPLDGRKGDELAIDGTLWGAIEIASPDPGAVISVTIDDRPRGFAPLKIDSLAPGPHQVRFSGPGMASWGQTIEVKVGEEKQVLTRALSSPSTGVLQIRASAAIDGEPGEVRGAKVFLDGRPHGVTPQSVELPRGPHSVRIEYHGESSAAQVIELPGGNQRYANFDLGTGVEPPKFKLDAPVRFPAGEPVVVSATFDGLPSADVREMWLHVRGADGAWERYAMSRLDSHLSAAGAVGAVTFPTASFDAQGRTQWYVSITSAQGDEFFTEITDASLDKPRH